MNKTQIQLMSDVLLRLVERSLFTTVKQILHIICGKVEKILKGSLHSIPSPSPSVKIQIMGGKVCL